MILIISVDNAIAIDKGKGKKDEICKIIYFAIKGTTVESVNVTH